MPESDIKAIQFKNITKSFEGKEPILKDLSLQIQKDEFVFLTGVSGSGKTTIFKILMGLEKAQLGDVYFFDQNINAIKKDQLPFFRRKIGVVFQDYKLIEKRSVLDNLILPLQIAGDSPQKIKSRLDELLTILPLRKLLNQKIYSLSGGEQQLVALGRASIHLPKVILADEPTANLDPNTAAEIVKHLNKLNEMGITIIVSTHDISLIKLYPRKVLLLKNQQIVEINKFKSEELTG